MGTAPAAPMSFFADYGSVVSTIAAILNGFIALVVARFFKERPTARIFLVSSAFLLSVVAVTATVVGQRETLAIKVASDAHQKEIREQLGKFIAEGAQIISGCSDNSKPPNELNTATWCSACFLALGVVAINQRLYGPSISIEAQLTACCTIQCSKTGPNSFFTNSLQAPTSIVRWPKSLWA